jgi:PAS domain S-box-containing protein
MKLNSQISQQLVENNLDSIVVTNSACEITFANKVAIELHGYSLEELNGKHISIFDVPSKEIPEESWATLTKIGKWSGAALRRRKDASTLHASLSIFTIFDERVAVVGFAGNTKNITDTVNIQKELIEKHQQLVSVIDNTEDVIVSIDKDLGL